MKKLLWIVVVAVGGMVIAAGIAQYQDDQLEADKTSGQRTAEAAVHAKMLASKRAAVAEANYHAAMATVGASMLRKIMKDPESFKLTSLTVMDDGAACYDYRTVNSFGAQLPNNAVMLPSGKLLVNEHYREGAFHDAWNKECAGKSGRNITQLVDVAGVLN